MHKLKVVAKIQLHNNFINVLISKLSYQLTLLSNDISNKMKMEINNIPSSGSYSSVGASEWRNNVQNYINFRIVDETMALVREIGLIEPDLIILNQALLINYGMGTSLDRSNPYLNEYLNSAYYNKNRKGFKVYTRPNEYVYDYETNSYYLSTSDERVEIPYFHQNPAHFFENGIIEIQQKINIILENIMDTIDISGFVF